MPTKKLFHHTSLYKTGRSLAVFIGLAIMFNSCDGCGCKRKLAEVDTTGSLNIAVDKQNLQEPDRVFTLSTFLAGSEKKVDKADAKGGDPTVVAEVKNFQVAITVAATGGKTPTEGAIKYTRYDESDKGTDIILQAGSTTKEPINNVFRTTTEGRIEAGETLQTRFEVVPTGDVSKIEITFQLEGPNGKIGDPQKVTWQSASRLVLEIDPTTIENDGFVKSKKIIVVIKKEGPGGVPEDLAKADLTPYYLMATPTGGTGSLQGGNLKKLKSVKGEIKITKIAGTPPAKKYVTVKLTTQKGNADTDLSLKLTELKDGQHVTVASPKIVKIHSLPRLKLEVVGSPNSDVLELQGNNRDLVLKITAESAVPIQDLPNLQLNYTISPVPNNANPTLLKDAVDVKSKTLEKLLSSKSLLGALDLRKLNLPGGELEITVTINPDIAETVEFRDLRLVGTATEAAEGYYKPLIKWTEAPIEIVLTDPSKKEYVGAGEEIISFTIKVGAPVDNALANRVKFSYTPNAVGGINPATLEYKNGADANGASLVDLMNLGGNDLKAGDHELKLKVKHNDSNKPVQTRFTDIALNNSSKKTDTLWRNPKVNITIAGNKDQEITNYDAINNIQLDFKAVDQLTEEDLKRLHLVYDQQITPEGYQTWAKLTYKGRDIKHETLFELLDPAKSIAAGSTPSISVAIQDFEDDVTGSFFGHIGLDNNHETSTVNIRFYRPLVTVSLPNSNDSDKHGFTGKIGSDYYQEFLINIQNTSERVGLGPNDLNNLFLALECDEDILHESKLELQAAHAPPVHFTREGGTFGVDKFLAPLSNLFKFLPSQSQATLKLVVKVGDPALLPLSITNLKVEGAKEQPVSGIPKITIQKPTINLTLADPNKNRSGYNLDETVDAGRVVKLKITKNATLNEINYDFLKLACKNSTGLTLRYKGYNVNNLSIKQIIDNLPAGSNVNDFTIPLVVDTTGIDLTATHSFDIEVDGYSAASSKITGLNWRLPSVGLLPLPVGAPPLIKKSAELTLQILEDLIEKDVENISISYDLRVTNKAGNNKNLKGKLLAKLPSSPEVSIKIAKGRATGSMNLSELSSSLSFAKGDFKLALKPLFLDAKGRVVNDLKDLKVELDLTVTGVHGHPAPIRVTWVNP